MGKSGEAAREKVPNRDRREVELFLSMGVAEAGWSDRTRAAYARDLDLYLSYLERLGIASLAESSADLILDFIARRRRAGDAPRTLNRRLAALRSFHKHLLAEKLLDRDVLALLPSPKRPANLPKYLTETEIAELLAVCAGVEPLAIRDHAIVELLYATGIRVSELCGLDDADVDAGDAMDAIKVMGKGGKQRFVPVHGRAVEALRVWQKKGRPALVTPDWCPKLFLSVRGGPLSRVAVHRRLRKLGLEAGIRQPVTPHLLRHTFATHLVHEGADLRSVQEMLGHANLETTTIYTSVDAKRLKEVHARHHPRS